MAELKVTLAPNVRYTLWWKFNKGEVRESHLFYDGVTYPKQDQGQQNRRNYRKTFNKVMEAARGHCGIDSLRNVLVLPEGIDPNKAK